MSKINYFGLFIVMHLKTADNHHRIPVARRNHGICQEHNVVPAVILIDRDSKWHPTGHL